jgi:hypothetical protein
MDVAAFELNSNMIATVSVLADFFAVSIDFLEETQANDRATSNTPRSNIKLASLFLGINIYYFDDTTNRKFRMNERQIRRISTEYSNWLRSVCFRQVRKIPSDSLRIVALKKLRVLVVKRGIW